MYLFMLFLLEVITVSKKEAMHYTKRKEKKKKNSTESKRKTWISLSECLLLYILFFFLAVLLVYFSRYRIKLAKKKIIRCNVHIFFCCLRCSSWFFLRLFFFNVVQMSLSHLFISFLEDFKFLVLLLDFLSLLFFICVDCFFFLFLGRTHKCHATLENIIFRNTPLNAMLCVRRLFLIIFLCGFTQKIHSFVCIFFSPNLLVVVVVFVVRQAIAFLLVRLQNIYINIYIKGASCFFGISFLVFLIDLKNLSNLENIFLAP